MITVNNMAKKLRPLALSLGVKIEAVERVSEEFQSPFDPRFGLDIDKKIVFFAKDDSNKFYNQISASLIHELGHALFDDKVSLNDYASEFSEYNWFGWEWEVSKSIGVEKEWRESNYNYCVTDAGNELGSLSKLKQNEVLEERSQFAKENGYLKTLKGESWSAPIDT